MARPTARASPRARRGAQPRAQGAALRRARVRHRARLWRQRGPAGRSARRQEHRAHDHQAQPVERARSPRPRATKRAARWTPASSSRSSALRRDKLDCLLLHRASHMWAFDGAIWERLIERLEDGSILSLGVSVQSPMEALAALACPDVVHLQLPFNLLDWRWLASGFQMCLAARPNVTVHARSAFLQGILAVHDPDVWPKVAWRRSHRDGADDRDPHRSLRPRERRRSVPGLCARAELDRRRRRRSRNRSPARRQSAPLREAAIGPGSLRARSPRASRACRSRLSIRRAGPNDERAVPPRRLHRVCLGRRGASRPRHVARAVRGGRTCDPQRPQCGAAQGISQANCWPQAIPPSAPPSTSPTRTRCAISSARCSASMCWSTTPSA